MCESSERECSLWTVLYEETSSWNRGLVNVSSEVACSVGFVVGEPVIVGPAEIVEIVLERDWLSARFEGGRVRRRFRRSTSFDFEQFEFELELAALLPVGFERVARVLFEINLVWILVTRSRKGEKESFIAENGTRKMRSVKPAIIGYIMAQAAPATSLFLSTSLGTFWHSSSMVKTIDGSSTLIGLILNRESPPTSPSMSSEASE